MDLTDLQGAKARLSRLAKQANTALPRRTPDRYKEVPASMTEWFEEPAPTFDLDTEDDGKPPGVSNRTTFNMESPVAELPPRADQARDDITGTGAGAEI